jgi:hypothetical protein
MGKQGNDGEPSPASFIYERAIQSGHHDATQSTLLADSVGWFCGGAAVVGGAGAE